MNNLKELKEEDNKNFILLLKDLKLIPSSEIAFDQVTNSTLYSIGFNTINGELYALIEIIFTEENILNSQKFIKELEKNQNGSFLNYFGLILLKESYYLVFERPNFLMKDFLNCEVLNFRMLLHFILEVYFIMDYLNNKKIFNLFSLYHDFFSVFTSQTKDKTFDTKFLNLGDIYSEDNLVKVNIPIVSILNTSINKRINIDFNEEILSNKYLDTSKFYLFAFSNFIKRIFSIQKLKDLFTSKENNNDILLEQLNNLTLFDVKSSLADEVKVDLFIKIKDTFGRISFKYKFDYFLNPLKNLMKSTNEIIKCNKENFNSKLINIKRKRDTTVNKQLLRTSKNIECIDLTEKDNSRVSLSKSLLLPIIDLVDSDENSHKSFLSDSSIYYRGIEKLYVQQKFMDSHFKKTDPAYIVDNSKPYQYIEKSKIPKMLSSENLLSDLYYKFPKVKQVWSAEKILDDSCNYF